MSLGRRMFAGSLWCVLDGWASELANLSVFLVLVRLLGPEEFGLVALATVFTTIATDLFGYSVTQVLVQRPRLHAGLCDTVFVLVVLLAGGATLLFVALAPAIAALFEAAELSSLLRWLSLGVMLHAISAVPLALLTRELRFDAIAKRSLAMIGGGGTVGIGLAVAGYGPWALVGQALTQAGISAVMLYGATAWRPGRRGSWAHLREIRQFVANVVGNRIVMLCDERAPAFIIGLFLGPAAVGHFNVAMRLVDIVIRMFVVPVNQVALPGIAQVQEDPTRVRGIVRTGITAASLASCPAFVGTAVIAPQLVPVALGPAWLPAIPVLQLLALRGVVWPVILYGVSLLYGLGRPGRMLALNAVDLVVNVVTLCLAAPFGIAVVAGISLLRVLFVRWPLVGGAIGRLAGVGIGDQARLLAPAVAGSVIMAGILVAARGYLLAGFGDAALLAALIALGVAVYGTAVLILRPEPLRQALELVAASFSSTKPRRRALEEG
jgi:O-antigen/teichoic acid export membrane protein